MGRIYPSQCNWKCRGVCGVAGFTTCTCTCSLPRVTESVTGAHSGQHFACKKVSKAVLLCASYQLVSTLADLLDEALHVGERSTEL